MVQSTPTWGSFLTRTSSYEDPAAMKAANSLMKNPLFNLERIKETGQPAVDKNKIKNFAQVLANQLVKIGPDGKPMIVLPTQAQGQQQLGAFATTMGFPPQTSQPVAKNWFGNPIYGNVPLEPQPQIRYGSLATGFRGGKKRVSRRKGSRGSRGSRCNRKTRRS